MSITSRAAYDKAQIQLKAGEKWIRETLSPLVNLEDYHYSGFVCFPNITDRDKSFLKSNGNFTDAELKVKMINRYIGTFL